MTRKKGEFNSAEQERFFGFTYYSVGDRRPERPVHSADGNSDAADSCLQSITGRTFDWKFIAWLLGYEAVLMGAFSALNVIQFWFWSLLELIPVVLLTIHGGTGHENDG